MAGQLHVAYSDLFSGAALVAGGTYACASGDSRRAQSECVGQPKSDTLKRSIDTAEDFARRHLIAPLDNLSDDRVYVFASRGDFVVRPAQGDLAVNFYRRWLSEDRIVRKSHDRAAHGFLTLDYGQGCGVMGSPWLQDCDYAMADEILDHLDPLPATAVGDGAGTVRTGRVIYFDQSRYAGNDAQLFPWGALYLPETCRFKVCGLHVALHGCQMNPEAIQNKFIEKSGYQNAAERHQVAILFPQAAKGAGNPNGCWDWFGVTGPQYATREGAQVKAIVKMLQALF